MDYRELRDSNRRLAILQFLAGEPDYKMNANMLKTLLAQIGDTVSYATLHADIAYLCEAGCSKADKVGDITVVQILSRGIDVASGTARIEGIARPRPQ